MSRRIVLVEDHGLIAQTLALALRGRGDEAIVIDPAEVDAPTAELAPTVLSHDPSLVLLDLDLGAAGDGLELLPLLVRRVPVLVVTGVHDPVRLARCVAAGASGILSKSTSFDEMLLAIDRAVTAGTLLTPHEREEHLARLRAHERAEQERLADFERLTPREAEVLGELVRGRSVEEIARRAVVSVATVRTQVRAILTKLQVTSQLAAIARVREVGWQLPQTD